MIIIELNIDAIAAKNLCLFGILGYFKAKLSAWCRSDKSTYEGSKIDGLVSNYGLQQLINEPTHRTGNSFLLYRLIILFSTKSSNGVRGPSLIISKLSPSNNLRKI